MNTFLCVKVLYVSLFYITFILDVGSTCDWCLILRPPDSNDQRGGDCLSLHYKALSTIMPIDGIAWGKEGGGMKAEVQKALGGCSCPPLARAETMFLSKLGWASH